MKDNKLYSIFKPRRYAINTTKNLITYANVFFLSRVSSVFKNIIE